MSLYRLFDRQGVNLGVTSHDSAELALGSAQVLRGVRGLMIAPADEDSQDERDRHERRALRWEALGRQE